MSVPFLFSKRMWRHLEGTVKDIFSFRLKRVLYDSDYLFFGHVGVGGLSDVLIPLLFLSAGFSVSKTSPTWYL